MTAENIEKFKKVAAEVNVNLDDDKIKSILTVVRDKLKPNLKSTINTSPLDLTQELIGATGSILAQLCED